MNLTTARNFVRYSARNAGDSSVYSDQDIDRAIQTAADQFVRRTRCTRRSDDVTITADSSVVSFLTLNTTLGFRPERVLRIWIPATVAWLDVIEHAEITRAQIETPATSTAPDRIGFDSYSTAEVYPTPSAGYTAKVQWVEPFTTWTPGGADPGTLNLPDDYLRSILTTGAPYELQKNEPEHVQFVTQRLAEFEKFIATMMGAGGGGAKVARRVPIA